MTVDHLGEALTLFETLKKEFHAQNADLKKCGELLAKLKVLLTKLSFLVPGDDHAKDTKRLFIAREVLETGAYYAIRTKDIPAFERYIAQLKLYYHDFCASIPASQRMFPLLGLNLLRLLAENKIAEFHTELELIDPEQLQNMYIKHPIYVEQCLMEGSYNKLWNSREIVPAQEYSYFVDILMGTIRNSIASCAERAYSSLPLADAASLLYLQTPADLRKFCAEHKWAIDEKAQAIAFAAADEAQVEIPAAQVIENSLAYARELERIV